MLLARTRVGNRSSADFVNADEIPDPATSFTNAIAVQNRIGPHLRQDFIQLLLPRSELNPEGLQKLLVREK